MCRDRILAKSVLTQRDQTAQRLTVKLARASGASAATIGPRDPNNLRNTTKRAASSNDARTSADSC